MWKPCDIAAGTCWFDVPGIGKFDDRVSCSITNAAAPKTRADKPTGHNVPPAGGIGLFSYDKGGVIINAAATSMMCSYQGDGGTMTRVADVRGGGCGCQATQKTQWSPACMEPQINMTGGCDNTCPPPAAPAGSSWLDCHQCAWGAGELSKMMSAQQVGKAGVPFIYNEVSRTPLPLAPFTPACAARRDRAATDRRHCCCCCCCPRRCSSRRRRGAPTPPPSSTRSSTPRARVSCLHVQASASPLPPPSHARTLLLTGHP
jgi:hypothetical protein